MDMDLDALKVRPLQTRLCHMYDEVRSWPRCAWTVSAALSLLSSRYLLVDLNVHYPLHLHLVQLGAAATIATILHLRRRSASTGLSDETSRPRWSVFVVLAALMASATIFSLQAVLHIQNLPTLAMLTVSAFHIFMHRSQRR